MLTELTTSPPTATPLLACPDSVVGETHAQAAQGRFILGITALRFFAVVRHWKQMWINNALRPVGWERWLLGKPEEFADFDSLSPPLDDNQINHHKKTDVCF